MTPREARKAADVGFGEMARWCGVSESYISGIETGLKAASLRVSESYERRCGAGELAWPRLSLLAKLSRENARLRAEVDHLEKCCSCGEVGAS